MRKANYSRRDFLSTALAAPALIASLPAITKAAGEVITFTSPSGQVQFILFAAGPQLRYRVTRANQIILDLSVLGILVDGIDLCRDSTISRIDRYRVFEKYPARGVHSTATDHCNGAKISLRHTAGKTDYMLYVRVYNDGIAFRYVVPGSGSRVPDEGTAFTIPAGSTAWFHDFEGHYEGIHKKRAIADVKDGEWAAPPLTIKLPNSAGYAAITEGALINYAGMGLRADGQRGFKAVLGHALPVSHPFDLRYGKGEAKRLSKPAAIEGTITTPWRVVMLGPDLNSLVNCDIVDSVSPPLIKRFFLKDCIPIGSNQDAGCGDISMAARIPSTA